jgi:hypothetical protein
MRAKSADPAGDALKHLAKHGKGNKDAEAAKGIIRQWASEGAKVEQGSLYKVDLPDEHIAKMLDWDKPLSQQSPEVQKAFAKAQGGPMHQSPAGWEGTRVDYSAGDPLGQKLYERLAGYGKDSLSFSDRAGQSVASDRLREMGVPGIKYLDQGSREKTRWIAKHPQGGINDFPDEASARAFVKRNPELTLIPPEQTRNYVIFDDKLPKILERNGKSLAEQLAEKLK